MTPTREEIISRLDRLPDEIRAQELYVRDTQAAVDKADLDLTDRISQITCANPPILKGTNETQRKHELHQLTEGYRATVAGAQRFHSLAQIELRHLQNRLSAAKAMARLFGGGE